MIGGLVLLLGLLAVGGGWLLLRRSGRGWRVGRLFSAAPPHSLAQAQAFAARGEAVYVRLHGRIDSDEEFPGDDARPIVYRRRRLQQRAGGLLRGLDWHTFDDERLAVPFGLTERGERIGVDVEALGDGLVVVPRVSDGVAADLDATPAPGPRPALSPDTPVRLRIEQVAATDHATACGVPRLTETGETLLGPGLGRPLLLTTLDLDEAMRVLGAERRRSLKVATALLVAGPALLVLGLLLVVAGR